VTTLSSKRQVSGRKQQAEGSGMGWIESGSARMGHGRTRGCARAVRVRLSVGLVLGLVGCTSFGAPSMERDRFDYVNAVASSWKQQTLLNIVKLRYGDTPVFLEVGQIIAGYQLEGTLALGGILNSQSLVGNQASLGTAARYTDRPTITYTPLTGAHFIQVLMTPIPPPALFRLVESGWPVDMLFQLTAQSINGVSNRKGGARGQAADPEFTRLLAALQRIQASGAIGLRVEVSEAAKREGTIMTIRQRDLPPEIQADRELVRKLLGLRPGLEEFEVVYGTVPKRDDQIAIQTRSGFQIMTQLGSDIEVPAEHIAELRTYAPPPEPQGDPALPPPVRIRSGISKPDDAFAGVKYRDHWYWIEDRDFRSKGTFTFLMIIMTLAEKGEALQPPIVTIQGN
jgi:hypothetical protein